MLTAWSVTATTKSEERERWGEEHDRAHLRQCAVDFCVCGLCLSCVCESVYVCVRVFVCARVRVLVAPQTYSRADCRAERRMSSTHMVTTPLVRGTYLGHSCNPAGLGARNTRRSIGEVPATPSGVPTRRRGGGQRRRHEGGRRRRCGGGRRRHCHEHASTRRYNTG
jgi:hypothetical protein